MYNNINHSNRITLNKRIDIIIAHLLRKDMY